MNGIDCEFMHNDPLKQLSYDVSTRTKFLGEEADVNYRAALEVSRTGELSVQIPENLPSVIDKPEALPRGVPKDVTVQYEKLIKVIHLISCCFAVPTTTSYAAYHRFVDSVVFSEKLQHLAATIACNQFKRLTHCLEIDNLLRLSVWCVE